MCWYALYKKREMIILSNNIKTNDWKSETCILHSLIQFWKITHEMNCFTSGKAQREKSWD